MDKEVDYMGVDAVGIVQGMAYSMQAAEFTNELGTKLLGMALDSNEQIGDTMVKMMESSVNPSLGQNIDVSL